MAGSKLIIQHKLKASTIIEVLISMVIIMVVFGMAMMIYANVIRSSLSVKKVRAEAILNEILTNDEKANNNSTQVLNI
jgi:Tfp pilus assembly protein PilV